MTFGVRMTRVSAAAHGDVRVSLLACCSNPNLGGARSVDFLCFLWSQGLDEARPSEKRKGRSFYDRRWRVWRGGRRADLVKRFAGERNFL